MVGRKNAGARNAKDAGFQPLRAGFAALRSKENRFLRAVALTSFGLAMVGLLAVLLPGGMGVQGAGGGKLLFALALYCGVMVLGLGRMLAGLGALAREADAIRQIEERSGRYIKNLDAVTFSLLATENPFLFSGTDARGDLEATAAAKMTQNIRADALGRRFDAVNLIVDRVLGDITSHAAGLRDAQQLAVRAGILCTFIGIVLALTQVGGVIGAGQLSEAAVQNSMNLIVSSLGLAFSTSIAGLAASILLQLMANAMRQAENKVIGELELQAARVQLVCRRVSEDTPLGTDIAALRTVLADHTDFMRRQETDLIAISSRFGDALSRTEHVLAAPIAAMEQTGRRLTDLLAAQSEAVGSLERMTASVADLEERVAAHFEHSAQRGAEIQQAALGRLAAAQDEACDTLVREIRSGWGREARVDFEDMLERRLRRTLAALEGAAEGQLRAMRRIATLLAVAMGLAAAGLLVLAVERAGLFDVLLRAAD